MNLSEELHRARKYLSGANTPPSNEANTCSWIIRPLLHSGGYDYHEIDEQAHDGAGNIPDFTLLPDTPHTWFLEAKKWTVALADAHVNQALNYANIQGRRWVVLSNGREWRLYDNYLNNVPPAERLVTTAKLNCGAELDALLEALSKASVQSGALERYAVQTRFTALLDAQLQTPNSEVLTAIRGVLKTKFGLSSVTPADLVAYFHSIPTASLPIPPPTSADPLPAPPDAAPLIPPPTSSANSMTLRELLHESARVNGRKPEVLAFPDGAAKKVFTWRDVTSGVVEWLFVRGKLPSFPFTGQRGGKRLFINTTPHFGETDRHEHSPVTAQGQIYYIHVNRSMVDFMRCLLVLCEEVGESPDGFRVTLKSAAAS